MNIFLRKTPWSGIYEYKPLEECHKMIDAQTDKFLDDIEAVNNTDDYKQKAIEEVKRLGRNNKEQITKWFNERGIYV